MGNLAQRNSPIRSLPQQRRPHWRRLLGNEFGGSLVELALIMPTFTLLLVGAAEMARLAYFSLEVNNAAQAGATYGAQNHTTASYLTNIQQAAVNDAVNVSGMTAAAVDSCSCTSGTAITCTDAAADCVAPARILEYVQVKTTATIDPLFHYPLLPTTYTLRGFAVMRVEQ